MTRFWRALVALLAVPMLALAAGVTDGSQWTGGGETLTVTVTMSPVMGDANTTYTDSAGRTSGPHVSTPDPTGGVSAAPEGTVRNPADVNDTGKTYRIKNGKPYYKNAQGKWVKMKKKKAEGRTNVDGVGTLPAALTG